MFPDNCIERYLDERIENCYECIRKSDAEYASIFERRIEQKKKYQAICAKMDERDRETLAAIELDDFYCRSVEEKRLYWQGCCDCIALLKSLLRWLRGAENE